MLFSLLLVGVLPYAPAVEPAKPWPSCALSSLVPRAPKPIFADVRRFIRNPEAVRHRVITFSSVGNVGMALKEDPHDLGEMVEDVLPGSQAFDSGVRKGWIIVEINGKPFSRTERLKDVAMDFDVAKKKGATLVVKFDVRTFIDCTNADCKNSDKFPTDSMQRCAEACGQVDGCQWWSFGINDDDLTCSLYSEVSGFTKGEGLSTGERRCAPVPILSSSSAWPGCVTEDADLHHGTPLFTDVRNLVDRSEDVRHRELIFKSDGNIGMVLREQPHELGEVVSDVQTGSQAESAGVKSGWIIKAVDGRPFNRSEKLLDVGADFERAKKQAPMLTVKFDVKTSVDCTDGNCLRSDKFPASSRDSCASACASIQSCAAWSYALEEEDPMCWLRSNVPDRLRAREGSVVGIQACRPSRGFTYFWYALAVCISAYALYRNADQAQQLLASLAIHRLFKQSRFFSDRGLELRHVENGGNGCDELQFLIGGEDETSRSGSTWPSKPSKFSGSRANASFLEDNDL